MASVELTPSNQLGFHRPLTRLVTQSLKIHNPHPHPIAFKVKTTAPKQYCVRPNAGRVESGESVEVQVLLQPLPSEPPAHAKCKDKFLVQSAFITPDEEMRTLTEMWAQTEKTNKSAIQEQKVKCVYLASEDGVAPNGIREEEEDVQESRVLDESLANDGFGRYTLHSPKPLDPKLFRNGGYSYWETTQLPYIPPPAKAIFAQAQSSPVVGHSNGLAESTFNPINVPVRETDHTKDISSTPPIQNQTKEIPSLSLADINKTGGPSPTNIALEESLSRTTSDSEKLKLALAEVDKLRTQLSEAQGPLVTGLRKRGVGAAGSVANGAETAVEKVKEAVHAPSGVPIEVVAALVVGVFVMTYLFF